MNRRRWAAAVILLEMALSWNIPGKFGRQLATNLAAQTLSRSRAPKLLGQLQRSTLLELALWSSTANRSSRIEVRPAASAPMPTTERARRVIYAPRLDGRADPGEIVWTWVPFEDDPANGKDRPVLVVGRRRDTLLGLMMSSNPIRDHDRNWVGVGSGAWDQQDRPSWVRMDRVLDVPEDGIRREGAILARPSFDRVAHRLVAEYHWH